MKVFCVKRLSFQLVVMFWILCLESLGAAAQGDAPKLTGMWKLNVAKSQIHGGPPPKSLVIGFEWDAKTQTMEHTAERVTAEGKRITGGGWAAKYTHVRLKRIDASTTEVFLRKDGKDVMSFLQVVSPDGKTLTLTRKRAGQDVADTEIYERQ